MQETNSLCSYGCGSIGLFTNKSGRLMCSRSHNSCPSNKKKNSTAVQSVYDSGKRAANTYTDSAKHAMAWNHGLTRDDHPSIAAYTEKNTGKRRSSIETNSRMYAYRKACQFNLVGQIERVDGYHLLVKYGMYHKTKNPTGVVRDHKLSVHYGFLNGIDSNIIGHPANCEFILQTDNAKKTFKSSLTLDDLTDRITKWDCEGNMVYLFE